MLSAADEHGDRAAGVAEVGAEDEQHADDADHEAERPARARPARRGARPPAAR